MHGVLGYWNDGIIVKDYLYKRKIHLYEELVHLHEKFVHLHDRCVHLNDMIFYKKKKTSTDSPIATCSRNQKERGLP
jgi:hypothetical protein